MGFRAVHITTFVPIWQPPVVARARGVPTANVAISGLRLANRKQPRATHRVGWRVGVGRGRWKLPGKCRDGNVA